MFAWELEWGVSHSDSQNTLILTKGVLTDKSVSIVSICLLHGEWFALGKFAGR